MTSSPDERKFSTFTRGYIRDNILLAAFRNSLRALTNPDTGVTFTEDEIQRATQPGSRFYIEADAIDILGQANQARALYFVDQMWPSRSSTSMLEDLHGYLWLGADSKLSATGGSGTIQAVATVGSIFVGSTTIPDASAAVATDPNGNRFQVLYTATVSNADGTINLSVKGIDTGVATNLTVGTILTWSANQPLGAESECQVITSAFSGGYDDETDSEYATRIEEKMRYKPAAGNQAHFRAWAQQSSTSVETAFVYPVAFHAGSVLVTITQKRGDTEGPLARVSPSVGTMETVTNYLTPPNSTVVPERAYVVVTHPNYEYADMVIRVAMSQGTSGGWNDTTPWPNPGDSSSYPDVKVTSVTSQTEFEVETDDTLPGGAASLSGDSAPTLMLWNKTTSRFVELDVSSVSLTGSTATIVLSSAPAGFTIATDQRLSPYTDRLDIIAESIEDYYDSLGPGEVIDLDTDPRASRGYRWPPPSEQYQSRAGQALVSRLIDTLGGVASDAELDSISQNTPNLPTNIIDGPNQMVFGELNIYPFAT